MQEKPNIRITEWEDLDKRKFFSVGIFMALSIRLTVYPVILIRTRLQVQRGWSHYNGTFDAFSKILKSEGVRGLYRGFLVNAFGLITGQSYITTYELVRMYVSEYSNNNTVKSFIAGGSASLVAQSFIVPFDVISQHLMIMGQKGYRGRLQLSQTTGGISQGFGQAKKVIIHIFRIDGPRGFYRGYLPALLTYVPNSAVWWPSYLFFAEQLSKWAPSECPHLVLQGIAGPMAAVTASTLTNPMDVIRARVQLEGKSSIIETSSQLLREEGARGFTKGLSARILSAAPTAFVLVIGYETLKKISLRQELVAIRHW
ncbi:solute carrier family 25 member 44-like [Hypanus sabinus]|uniref:solute carrier family 25 member 44-like n=1 Tax=Hypanus sabinus TaxID=79690 RepID=UPI0028C46637|nr:solute carrier family 25 member 44-like [Hypanus sabinus]